MRIESERFSLAQISFLILECDQKHLRYWSLTMLKRALKGCERGTSFDSL
jgi:hypothetical protein